MVPKLFEPFCLHVIVWFLLILTLNLAMELALISKIAANKVQAETGKVLMHWVCYFAAIGVLEPPYEQDWD